MSLMDVFTCWIPVGLVRWWGHRFGESYDLHLNNGKLKVRCVAGVLVRCRSDERREKL